MRVSCFNIRDTLVIMNIFIANYQNIGKSERIRKNWGIYEYSLVLQERAICILPVIPQSPENFVQDTELSPVNEQT